MLTIPFEILTSIFKILESSELAQCQLVCKSWNQASLKLLYSNIDLLSARRCVLYVVTLQDSPHLGKYLEFIKAGMIYNGEEDIEYNIFSMCYGYVDDDSEGLDEGKDPSNNWDRHGLLSTVIDNCPNLLKIENLDPSPFFLTTLSTAASQGRLSRLQYVGFPEMEHFNDYVNTVLAFKKTLNTLELPGGPAAHTFGSQALTILRKNLNEFSCLKTLKTWYYPERRLSCYDAVIDDCKYLTRLTLRQGIITERNVTRPTQTIRPHFNLETLKSRWTMINTEDQMSYILLKFPNLKSLIIDRLESDDKTIYRFSVNVLIKFFRFITGLKKSSVSMILNPEDCLNSWASVINEKISIIDLDITVLGPHTDSNPESVSTHLYGKRLILHFPQNTDYHIKLLSEVGREVRSLRLDIHTKPLEPVKSADQLVEIIKLCPSLQELMLLCIENLRFTDSIDYQNFELKILHLHRYDNSIGSLKVISSMFPNLKRLRLFISRQKDVPKTTLIDMPNSSFDVLTCSFSDLAFERGTGKVYIKLKTDAGLQFYSATNSQMQQINEDEYDHLHFDINCRSLTKLKLNTNFIC